MPSMAERFNKTWPARKTDWWDEDKPKRLPEKRMVPQIPRSGIDAAAARAITNGNVNGHLIKQSSFMYDGSAALVCTKCGDVTSITEIVEEYINELSLSPMESYTETRIIYDFSNYFFRHPCPASISPSEP